MLSLSEVDTIQDLKEWVSENMPGATVEEGEGGIIIRTNLGSSMGGYLFEREGEGDLVEDVAWSSSNPTGEIYEREGE